LWTRKRLEGPRFLEQTRGGKQGASCSIEGKGGDKCIFGIKEEGKKKSHSLRNFSLSFSKRNRHEVERFNVGGMRKEGTNGYRKVRLDVLAWRKANSVMEGTRGLSFAI